MNNREIATLVWIGLAFVVAFIAIPDFRRALIPVLKALAAPELALPLLAMLAYLGGLISLGAGAGLWSSRLTTDAIAWFIATGLGLFGASTSLFTPNGSLRKLLLGALGAATFVEVFMNLYVFPLPVELILVPLLTLLSLLPLVAGTHDHDGEVKRLVDPLLAVIGIALTAIVAIRLATSWDDFQQTLGWQRFALPVWLTIGALPALVLLGVYSVYERAFGNVRWASDESRRRWRARFALVTGLHLRAREVGAFNGPWAKKLTAASSLRDARAVVRLFRHQGVRPDRHHRGDGDARRSDPAAPGGRRARLVHDDAAPRMAR